MGWKKDGSDWDGDEDKSSSILWQLHGHGYVRDRHHGKRRKRG